MGLALLVNEYIISFHCNNLGLKNFYHEKCHPRGQYHGILDLCFPGHSNGNFRHFFLKIPLAEL